MPRKPQSSLSKIEYIRHSLAHLLATAVLSKFPSAKLGIGPTIENGFYYDFLLPRQLKNEDLRELEDIMCKLIKENLLFKGQKISLKEAKKIFRNQPFKLELIEELNKKGQTLKIYKTGDVFVDLCRGGHVKSTKEINPKAFKLTKIAGAYWKGDEKNPQLQRIYGVSFRTEKELNNYLKNQEEIEKRDHRRIAQKLEIFSTYDISPGAVFWHPNGMIIFRELEKLIRDELEKDDYQEISTPIMVKKELFEKSGHWHYYKENMFFWEQGGETYVLKPMNCPESIYIYSAKTRSYKDLPLRLSEIGKLHRNELSGTLGGLLRVRQITMDDAHIYCRPDQIQEEISKLLKLIKRIYKIFNFPQNFYLSTKPDKALGEAKLWKKAERALTLALETNKIKFKIKSKEGAFYGPKIDVEIKDALGRNWQLATVQLDLAMLPERFNLFYIDEKGKKKKPVVIHRAIYGSFERFIGILIEHFAGAFPVWLAPIQAEIINVGNRERNYAWQIYKILKNENIRAKLSDENLTVSKRIREAEIKKIPYILVIGKKEKKNKTVNIRHYRRGQEGEIKIEKFIEKIKKEIEKKSI